MVRGANPGAAPAEVVAQLVRRSFERWLDEDADATPRQVVGIDDLLADDAAFLRSAHARLVEQGTPAPAAATYLAGWVGGNVAGAAGTVVALTGAVPLPRPDDVRITFHPGGWPERVDLGHPRLLVGAAHPWAGRDDVEVDDGEAHRAERLVAALVDVLDGVIEACHGLARVGRAGLWNEVGDGLGLCLAYQLDEPVDEDALRRLDVVLATPGAPWRARPSLRFADAAFGRVHVAQKGGCCLAYTAPPEPEPGPADDSPTYCDTCSFRPADECDRRQVEWLERQRADRQVAGA